MKKLLLVVGLFLISFFSSSSSAQAAAVTWSEVQPEGNTDVNWANAKISMDGNVVLAGARDANSLYLSKDGGTTWTIETPQGDDQQEWFVVGMNNNGRVLLAGEYGGNLYLSIDGGDTWTDTLPAHDASNWNTGSVSGDGQTILAGANSGRLYVSTNGGASWSETQPGGNSDKAWMTSAVSNNGEVMLAGVYGGRLYRSTNRGSSWTEVRPAGDSDLNWNAVSLDRDGKTMLVAIDDYSADPEDNPTGKVYVSRDSGTTWTLNQPDGSRAEEWRVSSMSEDGKVMLMGYANSDTDGRLWLSQDSGTTWSETQPAGNAGHFWQVGAVSIDGYHLVVGIGSSSGTRRVYIGTLPGPQPVKTPGCSASTPSSTPDLFQIDTTDTKAKLYFTPVGGNTDKYAIAYGYTPGDDRFGAELPGNSSGVRSYTINYLSPDSTYYVRVRAGNGCATGGWSNEMKFTTASKGNTSGIEFYESFASKIIGSITDLIDFN